jgi:hypothetical protein
MIWMGESEGEHNIEIIFLAVHAVDPDWEDSVDSTPTGLRWVHAGIGAIRG